MPRITKRYVDSISALSRDKDYMDDVLKGFGVRVRKSGSKSYFVLTRQKGVLRRFTIGQHGAWRPESARQKAQEILGDLAAGRDPLEEQRRSRKSPTVKGLGERFLEEYVPSHCKPSTAAEYTRSVELLIIPKLGRLKVSEVDKKDIGELHHEMRKTPYQANRTLGVASVMFKQAEGWGLRPDGSNPCQHVKRYKEEKRERFLSPDEINRLGLALAEEEQGAPSAVAAFRLLLLTGCRLSEIQSLKWEYVDLVDKVFRLPDSKTGKKTIYINDDAVAVLKSIARVSSNAYVITGKKDGMYLTDLQKPWRRVRKLAGLEEVRIHDLRHTFASNAVSAGLSLPMIGKLLGHTQAQTTARYAHLMDEPVRQAGEMTANAIGAALAGR